MSTPFRFALLGLSPVECSLLETLFMPRGHDKRLGDCERVTDMYRAQLIIANGDDTALVRRLRQSKLLPPVLLVGQHQDTGWPFVPRPIQLHRVIHVLGHHDLLPHASAPQAEVQDTQELGRSTSFAETQDDTHQGYDYATTRGEPSVNPLLWHDPPPAASDFASLPPSNFASLPLPSHRPAPEHDDGPELSDSNFGDLLAPAQAPVQARTGAPQVQRMLGCILLVGSPRLVSSSLARVLMRIGFQVDFAHSLPMAQERVRSQLYAFAILDAGVLRNQTLSICSTLRRERQPAPHMIVVSDNGGVQRALSRLMGCDAWMVKPLHHQDLRDYLLRHLPAR